VRGIRGLDQRRVRRHRDRLLHRADLERDVERDELLRADAQALALEGLEALHRGPDGVAGGVERRERILARLVRHRVAVHTIGFVDQRDRHAGDHALCVLDRSTHAALERLRVRNPGGEPGHTNTGKYCREKLPLDSHNRPPKTTANKERLRRDEMTAPFDSPPASVKRRWVAQDRRTLRPIAERLQAQLH
jgi:hypothetical protein